ncbi:transaldolase family protein [Wolbachia endosymbiont of Dirofilaria (Dirofilaria) immitis]|uniref:transaldolase family protein n=1 Tax=Wolbachia endosymbiont of Dirofilaria (Dirofilaria) immitis TaxID=1812115 RepID=UPI00158D6B3F|nr:transaldolase family protein [Wolbachia endosymbiont of Dirofilaria (Dirofilaria) immitis]QKX02099.1 fructose-6-phosphate aldolase [Wolbachia endosymbiont of Dirofilaria (Dirofilaria) immitis]
MEVFLDSVDLDEIKELKEFIDGITTNPSLIAKSGRKDKYEGLISEICSIIKGPVSVEVVADTYKEMVEEGLKLAKIASNIVVKLPLTYEGLISCKKLWTEYKIPVNITLCFSPGQALLAAKAGACFVSPFVGRLDDINYGGLLLIKDICAIYSNYGFDTKVLAASVRNPAHVIEAAKLGADSITIPAKVFKQLLSHPLTDQGLAIFREDWSVK